MSPQARGGAAAVSSPRHAPTDAVREAIARERAEGRLAEYGWHPGDPGTVPGGCSWMGEAVSRRWGYPEDGGCYVEPSGRHVSHCWNILPDGSILDATADQFGEPGDGIRVAPAGDRRYLGTCDCGGDDQ